MCIFDIFVCPIRTILGVVCHRSERPRKGPRVYCVGNNKKPLSSKCPFSNSCSSLRWIEKHIIYLMMVAGVQGRFALAVSTYLFKLHDLSDV